MTHKITTFSRMFILYSCHSFFLFHLVDENIPLFFTKEIIFSLRFFPQYSFCRQIKDRQKLCSQRDGLATFFYIDSVK